MNLAATLKKLLGRRFHVRYPLARRTTWGIGGCADFFAEVHDERELAAVVRAAKRVRQPVTVLGFGSNLLVADEGIRGLTLTLAGRFTESVLEKQRDLRVGGAVRVPKFVMFAARHGFTGMEGLVGIPGTVGGAIVMNAGIPGCQTKDHLIAVRVCDIKKGKFSLQRPRPGSFGYRRSPYQSGRYLVVEGIFRFPLATDRVGVLQIIKGQMRRRQVTQPVNERNAGSVFVNPTGDFAARLIDASGLKGMKVGGAQVSVKHANFIVNTGAASAYDVLELMAWVRRKVREVHGVSLKPEVRFVGAFKTDPLRYLGITRHATAPLARRSP
ncbi:MAG: UDP-N-acetylmuramate dehydrogenase [Elusimicrobiota bacterium]